MRYLCVLLATVAIGYAQERPPDEKATRREKARELLDAAAKMITSARPEVQVASLLHLGDNYNLVDGKKALGFLEQAFAGAADLPTGSRDDARGDMQAEIVSAVADVSLDKALELLPQLPPPVGPTDRRLVPVEKIVRLLLEKSDFDRAIQVVESVGSTGEYPINAARLIFEKLPAEDARRVQVFGAAISAYVSRPRGPLGEFLSRHWEAVPRPLAESALQALLNGILDRKDEDPMNTTVSTAKGAVGFNSRQDRELFDIMHVVQAVNAKRAAELLGTRPELRAALEKFPMGLASMRTGPNDPVSTSVMQGDQPNPQQRAQQQLDAMARSRAAEAMAALKEDPQRALALVRGIPSPPLQAQLLGSIARSVSEKDPAMAKSVLDQTVKMLDDIKDPGRRIAVWDIVVEAAFRAKEDERARLAMDRGLSDAAELYKRDTDAERGNSALREYWPSTQSYRRLVHRAATLWGADAEPLLIKITDPDLALMARIEMAQALLERPTSASQSRFSGRGGAEQEVRQQR